MHGQLQQFSCAGTDQHIELAAMHSSRLGSLTDACRACCSAQETASEGKGGFGPPPPEGRPNGRGFVNLSFRDTDLTDGYEEASKGSADDQNDPEEPAINLNALAGVSKDVGVSSCLRIRGCLIDCKGFGQNGWDHYGLLCSPNDIGGRSCAN